MARLGLGAACCFMGAGAAFGIGVGEMKHTSTINDLRLMINNEQACEEGRLPITQTADGVLHCADVKIYVIEGPVAEGGPTNSIDWQTTGDKARGKLAQEESLGGRIGQDGWRFGMGIAVGAILFSFVKAETERREPQTVPSVRRAA